MNAPDSTNDTNQVFTSRVVYMLCARIGVSVLTWAVEWEVVRAENKAKAGRDARAITVAASEKASAARVASQQQHQQKQQKQQKSTAAKRPSGVAPSGVQGGKTDTKKPANDPDVRKALRQAEKAQADAELRVNTIEARIAELTSILEDATLYVTPEGVARGQQLGKELDAARDRLDEAMHEWGVAAERKQQISAGS